MLLLNLSRCLANAVHPARILLLISLSCFFFSGVVSLSQVDVAFNVLDLSVVDIIVIHHHLCLRLVHLQTLIFTFISIRVAFVVGHVGISTYKYVVGEVKKTVCLQASRFPSQSSEYAFECCREQLGRYGISLSYASPDVDRIAFFV